MKKKILLFIFPPQQSDAYATDVEKDDADVCHKNDSLPNDVAGILEVHDVNDNIGGHQICCFC